MTDDEYIGNRVFFDPHDLSYYQIENEVGPWCLVRPLSYGFKINEYKKRSYILEECEFIKIENSTNERSRFNIMDFLKK